MKIDWPPRDWRGMIALVAQVIGAAVLTGLAFWLVWILWRGGWSNDTQLARIDALAKALFFALGIILIVIASLGMAFGRRSVKASVLGANVDVSGGDDEPQDGEKP